MILFIPDYPIWRNHPSADLCGRYVYDTGNYTLILLLLAVLPIASVAAIVLFEVIIHRPSKAS